MFMETISSPVKRCSRSSGRGHRSPRHRVDPRHLGNLDQEALGVGMAYPAGNGPWGESVWQAVSDHAVVGARPSGGDAVVGRGLGAAP